MIRQRVLGLREQLAYLWLCWPEFRSHVRSGVLVSIGDLCPSELSATYTIRVSQRGGETPEVRVVEPHLKCREDEEEIPHMYAQERLCLFLPGSGEWQPDDPIALTIIPWASLWLYFYEMWHSTGAWLGGGVHPEESMTIRGGARGWSN